MVAPTGVAAINAGGVTIHSFFQLSFAPQIGENSNDWKEKRFSKEKINPMVGACGISAFPMSGRVIAKMALKEDPTNFIIQHAIGVNVAGQVASVVAGGLVLALIPALAK